MAQCLQSLPGGGCIIATQDDCNDAGGDYQGDGTECEPGLCPDPTGACCLPDGDCIDGVTEDECGAMDGDYRGDGSECRTEECPQPPTGACCFEAVVPVEHGSARDELSRWLRATFFEQLIAVGKQDEHASLSAAPASLIHALVDGVFARGELFDCFGADVLVDAEVAVHFAASDRNSVRQARREGNEALKKMKLDKEIGEDEEHRGHYEMQKLHDHYIGEINKALETKEKEILTG